MKILKFTGLAITTLVIAFILRYVVINSGVLDTVDISTHYKSVNESCVPLDIASGPEDIDIDTDSGMIYVSAYNRRLERTAPNEKAGIYAFHADSPEQVRLVSTDAPDDFQPHGISFWSDDQHKQLFVVSHRQNGDEAVEIFDVLANGDLTHKQSVMFDEMHSPNDVQSIGHNSFSATNDKGEKNSSTSELLSFLGVKVSSVVFYDGMNGHTVATDLSFANGINISPDGRSVYVAQSLPRNIRVYSRDLISNQLTHLKDIPLNTAPDNIDIDQDGQLWIGGHFSLFKYVAYKKDPNELAPSHIVKVNPDNGQLTDVYYDEGDHYRASTVGSTYRNKLFIGSVYEDHISICLLPNN